MRTAYRKPIMEYEKFVASDYVASCTKQAKYVFTGGGCGDSITSDATVIGEDITEEKFKEYFDVDYILVMTQTHLGNKNVYVVNDGDAFPNGTNPGANWCNKYNIIEDYVKDKGYINKGGSPLHDDYDAGPMGHFDDNIVEYNAS